MKIHEKKRTFIQILSAFITNSHFSGFINGTIYQGKLKNICVPGLNCYSCPGALGACPLGSLQTVLAGRLRAFPYYILGIFLAFATVFGRVICGFLCPFGLIQDLLYKIKSVKTEVPLMADRILRKLKYLMLLIPVILLPLMLRDSVGLSAPYFCKWICPAGTLEGALPLLSLNEELRKLVGFVFSVKAVVLALTVTAAILLYRPFCRYICPLGAFYGMFNRISPVKLKVDKDSCTNCMACEKSCGMRVEIRNNINSAECIRCGHCIDTCPEHAISFDSSFSVRSHRIPRVSTAFLVAAFCMITLGIVSGQNAAILKKAVRICLECIGIG